MDILRMKQRPFITRAKLVVEIDPDRENIEPTEEELVYERLQSGSKV